MEKGQASFTVLFALALIIITIGVQRGLGKTVAIIFSPSHITLDESI